MNELRVFVTVGTDHHIFGRLLGWVAKWAQAHPDDHVVVQHGPGPRPVGCESYEFLPMDAIRAQLAAADVVVCSAGPGAVMDSRAQGHVPIAVPRLRELGEAVDDHQVAFARHLDREGIAHSADSLAALVDALEDARSHPDQFRCDPPSDAVLPGVVRIGELVDEFVWSK